MFAVPYKPCEICHSIEFAEFQTSGPDFRPGRKKVDLIKRRRLQVARPPDPSQIIGRQEHRYFVSGDVQGLLDERETLAVGQRLDVRTEIERGIADDVIREPRRSKPIAKVDPLITARGPRPIGDIRTPSDMTSPPGAGDDVPIPYGRVPNLAPERLDPEQRGRGPSGLGIEIVGVPIVFGPLDLLALRHRSTPHLIGNSGQAVSMGGQVTLAIGDHLRVPLRRRQAPDRIIPRIAAYQGNPRGYPDRQPSHVVNRLHHRFPEAIASRSPCFLADAGAPCSAWYISPIASA